MEDVHRIKMTAYMEGESVVENDTSTASTLVNKGCFGIRKKDGLHLTLIEASYLLGIGRLKVRSGPGGRSLGLKDLMMAGSSRKERFLEGLLVFRDLRNRGLVVKEGPEQTMLVYPRGTRSLKVSPDICIIVARESDTVNMLELLDRTAERGKKGLRTIVSVVDSDWDITHYESKQSLRRPRRKKDRIIPEMDAPKGSKFGPDGVVMAFTRDRPSEGIASFMGTDIDGVLLLSLDEGEVLFGAAPDEGDAKAAFRHLTYKDLLGRGWLPKTGFKYGTHFRVYTSGAITGHSEMLVHCMPPEDPPTWESLSRAIRLSHSVRKRMVFSLTPGTMGGESVPRYLELEWTRP